MRKFIWAHIEKIIFSLIWIIVILSPVLDEFSASYPEGKAFDWNEVFFWWIGMLPFLVIFILNNFILIPLFFNRNRYKTYIISAIILVAGYSFNDLYSFNKSMEENMKRHEQMQMPPPPPPPHIIERPESPKLSYQLRKRLPVFFDVLLASLVVCFNISVIIFIRYQQNISLRKELENQYLQDELKYLRTQLNPHFFMNMLNNIHAMTEIDPAKAQEMIIELSKLMRYVLYESENHTTSLAKELDFVSNYINLMKQRFPEGKVKVSCDFPKNLTEECRVPPMMLMSFVENAFKHGVSYRAQSDINVTVIREDKKVKFICSNSKPASKTISSRASSGGVGLENTRRRLDLIYGDRYGLDIEDTEDRFIVNLIIPC